jgi:hypothetical protein
MPGWGRGGKALIIGGEIPLHITAVLFIEHCGSFGR